jgi:hypothetical protein
VVAYDDAVRRGMAWNTDRRAEDGALGSLVVIGDGVDATNTGAPGDSNWILRELVKYDWALAGAMCPMVSPTAVAAAAAAAVGEGVALAVELGGVRDTKFGGASTHDTPTPPRQTTQLATAGGVYTISAKSGQHSSFLRWWGAPLRWSQHGNCLKRNCQLLRVTNILSLDRGGWLCCRQSEKV